MAKETWEIELSEVTLDDVITLEGMSSGLISCKEIKTFLGRLVSNKTEEDIGQIPLPELREHLTAVGIAVKEAVAIPKESATP